MGNEGRVHIVCTVKGDRKAIRRCLAHWRSERSNRPWGDKTKNRFMQHSYVLPCYGTQMNLHCFKAQRVRAVAKQDSKTAWQVQMENISRQTV